MPSAAPWSPWRTRANLWARGGRFSWGDSTSRRNLLFTLVKSSAIQIRRNRIYVFLASNSGEEAPDFVVRGNYYDDACAVSSKFTIAQASVIFFQFQNHAVFTHFSFDFDI